MKKRLSVFVAMLLLSVSKIFAQQELEDALTNLLDDWIRPSYPLVAGIVFIIGALINLGLVMNAESRDVKKFVSNVAIYLAVVFSLIGILEAILSMSTN